MGQAICRLTFLPMKAFTLPATLRSLFFHAFQCCVFVFFFLSWCLSKGNIVKINIALQLGRALAFRITLANKSVFARLKTCLDNPVWPVKTVYLFPLCTFLVDVRLSSFKKWKSSKHFLSCLNSVFFSIHWTIVHHHVSHHHGDLLSWYLLGNTG